MKQKTQEKEMQKIPNTIVREGYILNFIGCCACVFVAGFILAYLIFK